ncbi:MAG: hypothetical protein Kow0042_26120 [Calditrichia bacterium]
MKAQNNHSDDLEGIVLALYEKEIEKLSAHIVKNLGYLISIGVVEEVQSQEGRRIYRLLRALDDTADFP